MNIVTILISLSLIFGHSQEFDYVNFKMLKRTVGQGRVTTVNADVIYKASGDMITYFKKPMELYVLNNDKGDVQIYDPAMNTVVRSLDNRMSSQNTTFYYFLIDQSEDLGLKDAGFTLMDSRIEDMMLIMEWKAPVDAKKVMDKVELVSNGDYPIFMGYIDSNGAYVKKIYYYDFDEVANSYFPMSITEIDFNQEGDSVITKTSFSDFQFEGSEHLDLVNFKIPVDAKITK